MRINRIGYLKVNSRSYGRVRIAALILCIACIFAVGRAHIMAASNTVFALPRLANAKNEAGCRLFVRWIGSNRIGIMRHEAPEATVITIADLTSGKFKPCAHSDEDCLVFKRPHELPKYLYESDSLRVFNLNNLPRDYICRGDTGIYSHVEQRPIYPDHPYTTVDVPGELLGMTERGRLFFTNKSALLSDQCEVIMLDISTFRICHLGRVKFRVGSFLVSGEVSPDGRHIAWLTYNYNDNLRGLSILRVLLGNVIGGSKHDPRPSLDVWTTNGTGEDLRPIDTLTLPEYASLDPFSDYGIGSVSNITWSPDSAQFAFIAQNSGNKFDLHVVTNSH